MALSHLAFATFPICSSILFFGSRTYQEQSGCAYLGTQTSAHTSEHRPPRIPEMWPLGSGLGVCVCAERPHRGVGEGGGCGLAHIRRISCAYLAHKGELAQAPWNRGLKGFSKSMLYHAACVPQPMRCRKMPRIAASTTPAHTLNTLPGTYREQSMRFGFGTHREHTGKKAACAVHG